MSLPARAGHGRIALLGWLLVVVLLVPAAVITVSRLAGWEGRIGVGATAFAPLALLPYAVAAVLLGCLISRRPSRRPALVVIVPVLAALGLHLTWATPLVAGDTPAADPDASTMTVMTANILHDRGDGAALVRSVAAEQVDLLVVPEIGPRVLQEMTAAGIDELLPHRAGTPGVAVEGTMIFAGQPITEVVRLPTALQSWQARVGDLSLFAVHPAYPVTVEAWRTELAALLEATEQVEPDLLIGDFNATLDHLPMRRFAEAGYRSAAEIANSGWQPTWPANGLFSALGISLPTLAAIDHVLVGPASTALSTSTVNLDNTDHRALIATVAVGLATS